MRCLMAILAIATLYLCGCATTSISSIRATPSLSKVYRGIWVVTPVQDIGMRKLIEVSVMRELNQSGRVFSMASVGPLYPERDENLIAKLQEAGSVMMGEGFRFDSYLVVLPTEAGVSTSRTPSVTRTNIRGWVSGDYFSATANTQTLGGSELHMPWVNFSVQLFDTVEDKVAWIASARTSGSDLTGPVKLVQSMAAKVVNQMMRDGCLGPQVDVASEKQQESTPVPQKRNRTPWGHLIAFIAIAIGLFVYG